MEKNIKITIEDLICTKRNDNESFEEYKKRRFIANKLRSLYLKGRKVK
jgi:hypothetical protein